MSQSIGGEGCGCLSKWSQSVKTVRSVNQTHDPGSLACWQLNKSSL